ncbi:sigma-70 family RNA polymerase sigma factor [Pedobacter miscanthi]|uniref:RNA polymerase sigma factor n=1 Tax=Pedobacter miscanthi TaxID=2259170 RepID=UPI00292F23D5|nr:sigma-70 family RNA polymerase sigma factor [Pedobacter miscanthi]
MKKGKDLKTEWEKFILEGNTTSFYDIYAHYHDYFTYIGAKKGASAENIKDCINDLFLYVYENKEKLGHITNHHNYLITSFLRKLFRKQHFSAEESLDLYDLEEMPTYPSVETQYIRQHTSNQVSLTLKNYIDKLSESQSRLIYQKFYLGLSYDDIAISNGIAVKTAYNTIYNAVEKLKKIIGEGDLGALSIAISLLSLLILIFFKFL